MTDNTSQDPVLHPYIEYIKHRLEALLNLVELEKDGKVMHPTGFRLKNLEQWTLQKSGGLLANLDPISSYCNARCDFCYEIGNPLPYERTLLSLDEARTRIKYYKQAQGRGLLQPRCRLYLEPFVNRNLLNILRLIREQSPEEMISLTTNGSFLTADTIRELAELKPIALIISINSSDPEKRRELMHDPRAATALDALPALCSHQIPFVGSVVAWHTLPPEEIADTIRFIDRFSPRAIRVTLPGYSRYFSEEELFDTSEVWSRVCTMLDQLRPRIRSPLIVLPNLYWNMPLIPRIDGIIPNSPAERAGLVCGDLLVSLDEEPILTKEQGRSLLLNPERRSKVRELEVLRDNRQITVKLMEIDEREIDLYPYKPRGYQVLRYDRDDTTGPYGILLNHDFELSSIQRLMDIVASYGAKNVLFFTSEIIKPMVEAIFQAIPEVRDFFSRINLNMVVPSHAFWGGNIMLGDLYMVSDYLEATREYVAQAKTPPDLIVLPSSFATEFGRDLLGASYMELEREMNMPVELLPCRQIII